MTNYAKIADLVHVAEHELNRREDALLSYLLGMVEEHCALSDREPGNAGTIDDSFRLKVRPTFAGSVDGA